ncbi:hypothetical protein ACQPTN_40905 [Bradyrhizobium sp. 13971]
MVHLVAGGHRLRLLLGELGQVRIHHHGTKTIVLAVLREHDRGGLAVQHRAGLCHVEIHGRFFREFGVGGAAGKHQKPEQGDRRPFHF